MSPSPESFLMMLPDSIPPKDRVALGLVAEALAKRRATIPPPMPPFLAVAMILQEEIEKGEYEDFTAAEAHLAALCIRDIADNQLPEMDEENKRSPGEKEAPEPGEIVLIPNPPGWLAKFWIGVRKAWEAYGGPVPSRPGYNPLPADRKPVIPTPKPRPWGMPGYQPEGPEIDPGQPPRDGSGASDCQPKPGGDSNLPSFLGDDAYLKWLAKESGLSLHWCLFYALRYSQARGEEFATFLVGCKAVDAGRFYPAKEEDTP